MSEINSNTNVEQIPAHSTTSNINEVDHKHKVGQSDQISITSNLAPHPIFNQEQQIQLNELKNRAASLSKPESYGLVNEQEKLAGEILEFLSIDPNLLQNLRPSSRSITNREIITNFAESSDPKIRRANIIHVLAQGKGAHIDLRVDARLALSSKNPDNITETAKKVLEFVDEDYSLLDKLASAGNFLDKESASEIILKKLINHQIPQNFEFIPQVFVDADRFELRNQIVVALMEKGLKKTYETMLDMISSI